MPDKQLILTADDFGREHGHQRGHRAVAPRGRAHPGGAHGERTGRGRGRGNRAQESGSARGAASHALRRTRFGWLHDAALACAQRAEVCLFSQAHAHGCAGKSCRAVCEVPRAGFRADVLGRAHASASASDRTRDHDPDRDRRTASGSRASCESRAMQKSARGFLPCACFRSSARALLRNCARTGIRFCRRGLRPEQERTNGSP